MEVRDPIHGSIHISENIKKVIKHPFFQRLRNIKQLGFSEYVFPGATHSRFLHSIGVMSVSQKAFDALFPDQSSIELQKLKETLKLACLLHDIGHAPLSHATEAAMPQVEELKLPKRFQVSNRQANHEDYTIKAIVDSSLTTSLDLSKQQYGVEPDCVAQLVTGKCLDSDYFTVENINYFPILHQLVSSEIDCDRMDYLLRDSYFCGVSYGVFDLDWVIDNLGISIHEGKAHLGISHRAVSTFDDFLLSRYHMFIMVYYHYRAVCLEKMLMLYLKETSNEYLIPSCIEEYKEHDDSHLLRFLKNSSNPWARRIIENRIVPKVFETYTDNDQNIFNGLEKFLDSKGIFYISSSSKGRLSKYYNSQEQQDEFALKVISPFQKNTSIDIHQATDLFNKYSTAHQVSRIYIDFDELNKEHQKEIHSFIYQ